MQNTNKIWAAAIAVIVIALIAIAFLQRPTISAPATNNSTTTPATATTTIGGITASGDFAVSPDVDTVELQIPDFRAPLKFSPDTQADVKAALQNAANTLIGRIADNGFDLEAWINLGTVRKMAGDYRGAETAWKFVTQAAPKNSIAYNNLGDLYANFLKDYPKAEQAYLTAIKYNPAEAGAYRDLSVLYAHLYKKGTTAAEDILKKGVAAAPDSVDLHVLLARYYREAGRASDAKVQYDAAIAAALKAGQSGVAEQLRTESNQ
jgi:tetratricopeptide (TPR) repeat protein